MRNIHAIRGVHLITMKPRIMIQTYGPAANDQIHLPHRLPTDPESVSKRDTRRKDSLSRL